MDHKELSTEMELASRMSKGVGSRVVILQNGVHYEVQAAIPHGDDIVLVTGREANAPVDNLEEVEETEADHLRIAEDQPEQDPDPRDTKGDLDFHEGREEGWR